MKVFCMVSLTETKVENEVDSFPTFIPPVSHHPLQWVGSVANGSWKMSCILFQMATFHHDCRKNTYLQRDFTL